MHFLNKMERKFGRFAIQGLMKYIILFYVAGYLIEFLAPQAYSFLTLEPFMIFHYGQVWRLVSWVLIPPPTGNFILCYYHDQYCIISLVLPWNVPGERLGSMYIFLVV